MFVLSEILEFSILGLTICQRENCGLHCALDLITVRLIHEFTLKIFYHEDPDTGFSDDKSDVGVVSSYCNSQRDVLSPNCDVTKKPLTRR